MGKLISGGILSSEIKGKVGDVVFTKLNKETVIKKYQPIVANPNTLAQQIQRTKFKTIGESVAGLYNITAKKYGVKLPQDNIYSAMSRTVFQNKVVLSMGYANNYYPKKAPNTRDLLAYNNDINGDILQYLSAGFIIGENNKSLEPGFLFPKNIVPVYNVVAYSPGVVFIGSNFVFDNVNVGLMVNGNVYNTINAFDGVDLSLNENYTGVDNFGKFVSNSKDTINTKFKYIYKVECSYSKVLSDGSIFISFAPQDHYKPTSYFNAKAEDWNAYFLKCGTLGEALTFKMGISLFAFTSNINNTAVLNGDNENEYAGTLLQREMVLSKNIYLNFEE